jgi:hypothetical protein
VKARLQTPVGAVPASVKPVPARSPEPVGPAASIGDGSSVPTSEFRQNGEAVQPESPKSVYLEAAIPYVGEDRRKNNRRSGILPTTLDTRKGGVDRRKKGRISLKV